MKNVLMVALLFALTATAQEPVDWQAVSRIRAEAFDNGQVMEVLRHLTEEIGPRLTNSPSMKKANEYTRDQLREWGLDAALEPWGPFGLGWSYEHASLHMLSPRRTPLLALPKAWTPGTDGPVTGAAIYAPIGSVEDMESHRGKLSGKIVLIDEVRAYEPKTEASFQRYSHEELEDICHYEIDESKGSSRRNRYMKYYMLKQKIPGFLKEEGALAAISISSRDDGIIRVAGGGSWEPDGEPGVPHLVVGAEYYNMVVRRLDAGDEVELEVNVKAQFHKDDLMGYNTIGEIPGQGKLAKEIVMLGAHLDSWHGGSGALDNGAGVAVVMEAMRLLKSLDMPFKRTVRVGLWSGEEQGLRGSRAYVEKNYAEWRLPPGVDDHGSPMTKYFRGTAYAKKGHENFSAYFNLDNGGGKIRGIYTQKNGAVAPIFKAWLEPFNDTGASWISMKNTGGTDHQSFDGAGLPGFQFIQDPLSYMTKNHHTNLDVFDHVQEGDLKQAAAIMAAFAYHAAMRDEKLPRKPMKQPPREEEPKKKGKKKGQGMGR